MVQQHTFPSLQSIPPEIRVAFWDNPSPSTLCSWRQSDGAANRLQYQMGWSPVHHPSDHRLPTSEVHWCNKQFRVVFEQHVQPLPPNTIVSRSFLAIVKDKSCVAEEQNCAAWECIADLTSRWVFPCLLIHLYSIYLGKKLSVTLKYRNRIIWKLSKQSLFILMKKVFLFFCCFPTAGCICIWPEFVNTFDCLNMHFSSNQLFFLKCFSPASYWSKGS